MNETFVQHSHIKAYADDSVNLKMEDVKEYREQVGRLRETMTTFVNAHPDYGLIKMLQSGSVAKGTALKTINDMDVAVYIRSTDAPQLERDLVNWLMERLRLAYPNMKHDQFEPQSHCATIKFRGTGLDVDVVPVIYDGGADDRGYLINQETGDRVLTSIPLHLEFIRKRKDAQPHHFRQVVRLVKWWVRNQKINNAAFRCKSFLVELICAHLADAGLDMSDYPVALEAVFAYIVTSGLKKRISFTDYYKASELPSPTGAEIEVFDPVNPDNNITSRYTANDVLQITEAANDALDALSEAHYSTTQGRAVERWKSVLGPSFKV